MEAASSHSTSLPPPSKKKHKKSKASKAATRAGQPQQQTVSAGAEMLVVEGPMASSVQELADCSQHPGGSDIEQAGLAGATTGCAGKQQSSASTADL